MTRQPKFKVASFEDLEVTFVGPAGAGPPSPATTVSHARNAIRFGISIGRLVETSDRGHGQLANNQVVHFQYLSRLVAGPWDIKLSWDAWEISQRIEIERRWMNAKGAAKGFTRRSAPCMASPVFRSPTNRTPTLSKISRQGVGCVKAVDGGGLEMFRWPAPLNWPLCKFRT